MMERSHAQIQGKNGPDKGPAEVKLGRSLLEVSKKAGVAGVE